MASKAHAFFCFESLSASYEQRGHPDLQTVLDLYRQYQHGLNAAQDNVDDDPDEDCEERDGIEIDGQIEATQERNPLPLPSISRLQASAPSSRSATSTPSSVSVNSSNSQLTRSSVSSPPASYASRLSVTESYPMFVTWNIISRSGHKSLRGCIGTFEPLPLENGLETYALTSAFEDTRFSPISASQMPNLSCSLTLLADFEVCEDAMDWSLGKHGIRISFTHRYRKHGATYLPDVAVEQGWDKEETLESLMRKAGWEPPARRLLKSSSKPWAELRDFRVIRYTGLKASASYSEWQEWRQWAKTKLPIP